MLSQHTLMPIIEQEEWHPVVGYEGWYDVSNLGRVQRIKGACGTHSGNILRWTIGRGGYPRVCLSRRGCAENRYLHHLVAEAFLGPRPQGLVINHKDRNKWNPRVTNLEYVTTAENNRHAEQTGVRRVRGSEVKISHLTEADIPVIRDRSIHYRVLMTQFSISKATVFRIRRREIWRHVA